MGQYIYSNHILKSDKPDSLLQINFLKEAISKSRKIWINLEVIYAMVLKDH
jgi:hypothetical protein